MKKLILIVIFTLIWSLAPAQESVEEILSQVESNNVGLKALAERIAAEKVGTRLGLYPDNPEVEVAFLRGVPGELGRRTDWSLKQSFDFPLAYLYKAKMAKMSAQQLDWRWQIERKALRLEVRLLCYDLIRLNALKALFDQRLRQAREMTRAYEIRFEKGETNILELNKVRLSELTLQKETETVSIERAASLADLVRFNGGVALDLIDTEYVFPDIDPDFERCLARAEGENPYLSWMDAEVGRLQMQVKVDRSLALPKLSIGYMREAVEGERYDGVTAGITLPLFEHKSSVKFARAKAVAGQSEANDARTQYQQEMRSQHQKVLALKRSVEEFRRRIVLLDNSPLLDKAMEMGELSLIEYLYERSLYQEALVQRIESECQLMKACAVLNRFSE